MSVCNFTTQINPSECIGDSLYKLNDNWVSLDKTTQEISAVVNTMINDIEDYFAGIGVHSTDPKSIARAWVNFNGTSFTGAIPATSTSVIRSSFNVKYVTKHAVGEYSVTFVDPLPTSFYPYFVFGRSSNGNMFAFDASTNDSTFDPTPSSIRFKVHTSDENAFLDITNVPSEVLTWNLLVYS